MVGLTAQRDQADKQAHTPMLAHESTFLRWILELAIRRYLVGIKLVGHSVDEVTRTNDQTVEKNLL